MKHFEYKGNMVAVRQFSSSATENACFCCGKKIHGNAVLLVNNYKNIPNMILHADCFNQHEHNTNKLCSDIEESYKQFKHLEQFFG